MTLLILANVSGSFFSARATFVKGPRVKRVIEDGDPDANEERIASWATSEESTRGLCSATMFGT